MPLSLTGLRAQARAQFADALGALDRELGARVTVYDATPTRAADGSETRAWAAVAAAVPMRLRLVTNEAARRQWGEGTEVVAEGATTGRTVTVGQAVRVTTARDGFPVGARYLVDEALPADLSGSVRVALVPLADSEDLT
ncbi:MAG: hypothetical protein ACYC1Z_14115 [Georgenia sp.]